MYIISFEYTFIKRLIVRVFIDFVEYLLQFVWHGIPQIGSFGADFVTFVK